MAQGGKIKKMILPEEGRMLAFKDYNDDLFVGTFIKSEDMFFRCRNLKEEVGDFEYSRFVKEWKYINI